MNIVDLHTKIELFHFKVYVMI